MLKKTLKKLLQVSLCITFILVFHNKTLGVVIDKNSISKTEILENLLFVVDSNSNWSLDSLKKKDLLWTELKGSILNFGMSNYTYWCKLDIDNHSTNQYLSLGDPIIDEIDIFFINNTNTITHSKSGSSLQFKQREINTTNYLFKIPKGNNLCYIKIKSNFNIQIPIKIAPLEYFMEEQHDNDIALAMYFGLMLIMILYNLFIYISVKDKTYLYYILYMLLVSLSYGSFKGLTYEYLWYNNPYINFLIPSIASLAIIFVGLFSASLLEIKSYAKKLLIVFKIFIGIFITCIIINLMGDYEISAKISQLTTLIFSIYLIVVGVYSYRKGVKAARFFLLAWTLYLLSIVIFILKLNGVISYNSFTNNSVLYGSAIEVLLLSFALADRINIMRAEKEASQLKIFEVLKENEKIIKEQNVILEEKVKERTTELNQTLDNLKDAQTQLVDAEKMSSLGQLTAGIAHEINNPINFVSSNIPPLRQDIEDLKTILNKYEEIDASTIINKKLEEVNQLKEELDYDYLKTELETIVNGIEDGARRTAEIVSGLKNFSRLDEIDLQTTDINEGIDSTLILIKNKLGDIKLTKELANLPLIECYPSKLNQLFMNIMDNAIHAVKTKKDNQEKEISVKTYIENNNVVLTVKDNGIGMNNETKEKIFEPFYTSKPVGEGTGLGMSIAYSIIKAHNASIDINTKENEGTELIIKIPFNNG